MIFSAYLGQQRDLQWATVTLTVISTLLLIWRISSTINSRGWLGLEDAFVIIANIWLILTAAFIYKATMHGFGMHVVDIQRTGGDVTQALKFFWLTQSFYTLTNGFNKMAFLALYYRVFPMQKFRLACKALGLISVAWTTSFLFVCIFQCTPVSRVYNRKLEGTCIDFVWHRWSNAVLNLLTDLAIFILPMPVIFGLNMSIGSRIGLVVLFSIGFFICLTTALRMATLPLTLKATEPTWQSAPTNLWSFIEAATGVICACLISLRRSIEALWPKKWSHKGLSGVYQQYRNNEPGSNNRDVSLPRKGIGAHNSLAMGGLRNGAKSKADPFADNSASESRERIMVGSKTVAQVTTSRPRSSSNGSEDLALQGITVTTDFKVVRD